MELQLLTLQHCLISPTPILNAGVPPGKQYYLVEGEENGQDQLSTNIMFTCKLYYAEGLPLLYGRNTFMYTEPWAFRRALYTDDMKARQRRANSPSPETITGQPPHDSNFALANHAANLHLRLTCFGHQLLVKNCVMPLRAFNDFLNLKSLHVDSLDLYKRFPVGKGFDTDWDARAPWMMLLAMNLERITAKHKNLRKLQRGLKEISFTGLPRNDFGLVLVKQYSRLLAPDGRFGVGWGVKGNWYELPGAYEVDGVSKCKDSEVSRCEGMEIMWMAAGEVGEWIARENTSGSEWLFEEGSSEDNDCGGDNVD